ncbi:MULTISPECIES: iron ABC transporter substrate-binding protein [unclassified Mesorhizobium]|uniref:iron ABC transporter substrate-binding protein n=1 Tax=unclassified Mesorhizobium TaxID=325217 RepID=UPI000FCC9C5A|nr:MULTISPECIES: iron ABC transporter substrate-binding protein [unclassified Mesorhizobium]TGP24801.1 iron ABC transporter substrate-binding protein [Mesorhizobium sp. M1D.F.Ca.ET.231.01.1.1]TGP36124.1 iron ABC transporter substrate-binding protein [Mesorhizobium sp. M1D.F.Ca.ET.234.01.1.1]TGS49626.1 iron ABC transporter substrate-binding protein [Mesorhizobium sp. M1D.F.Ca.ET.184.01.1.1]TGS64338.1 iron ABC transporter substrate-binding protein [Mesorhizobium sp. M1D.F.Ca.ET.183.01.1.1]
MKYALSTLAGAVALTASLIAGPALAEDAGIIVYNAQHESLAKEWAKGFTKETGIKVTLRNGGDSDFSNQIVAEGAASPADVFLTENSPAMALVEAAGLFAPVDAETLAQVPQEYQPSSGKWVGVAARSTVFAYNKDKLKEDQLPKSLLDLADPSWKGRWAASPSGADFQAIVGALVQLKGEAATADWLKAMKDNFTAYKGNSTVMKAVNAGEIEGGVIYHYYYFGDQAKTGENSKNIGLHYFKNQDPGAFVSISGGGVLASSKHQKEAQAFLKWVTGKGGQEVLKTGTSYEYAVGKGAGSNPKLVPLADLQAPKVDPAMLNSKKVIDLMTQAGLL